MARRGVRRKLLGALLGLALVVFGAAALLPALLNRGLLRGMIEDIASDAAGAPVRIDTLALSWFDAQQFRGVHVADDSGGEAALVDVRVQGGLLGLALGGDALDVTIAGSVRASLRADGSTSVDPILRRDEPSPPDPAEPTRLPAVRIALAALDVTLVIPAAPTEEGGERGTEELRIDDLDGVVSLVPGATATVSLSGKLTAGARQGVMTLAGKAERVLDVDGILTLSGATLESELALEGLGLPSAIGMPERIVAIERAVVRATSDDLARTLAVVVEADTRLRDDTLESLRGRVAVEHGTPRPFELSVEAPYAQASLVGVLADDGTLRAAGGAVSASVAPALLATLAGLDAEAPLEVGVTIASLVVPGAGADGVRDLGGIECDLRAELRAPARLSRSGAPIAVESLVLDLDAAPLRDGLALYGVLVSDVGGVTISERLEGLIVDGTLAVGDARPVGHLRVQDLDVTRAARLAAQTALVERLEPLEVARLDAQLETSRADGALVAALTGTTRLGDTRFEIEARGAERAESIDVDSASISGQLTPALVRGLQAAVPGPAPEGDAVTAAESEAGAEAETEAQPVRLEMPAALRVDVERVRFPRRDGLVAWASPRLVARVTTGPLAVGHPQLARGVQLQAVTADLAASPRFVRFALAPTEARDAATGRAIATLSAAMALAGDSAGAEAIATEPAWAARRDELLADSGPIPAAGDAATLAGLLEAGRWAAHLDALVESAELARTLGRDAAELERWLGERDGVKASITPRDDRTRLAVETTSRRLALAADVLEEPDAWVIEAGSATVPVSALVVGPERDPGDDAAGAPPRPRPSFRGPLHLDLARARLPKALLASEALPEGAVASIDAGLRSTELRMLVPGGAPIAITLERGQVRTDDLARGLEFSMAGRARPSSPSIPGAPSSPTTPGAPAGSGESASTDEAGRFELSGRVAGILDAERRIASADAMQLDATVHADRFATATLDALADLDGLLVAAAGPAISADLEARGFSRSTGRLDIVVAADATRIEGRLNAQENRLFSAGSNPLHGTLELTPPLRDRLLANVHPLLADMRTVEQPITATLLKGFAIPLDGDIARLNGDLEITIGAVELDTGSVMLSLLSLVQEGRATIPAYIEPIAMKIRQGVVRTQRFAVRLDDKLELVFSGDVDLNTRLADLRTEIPLSALASAVEETQGIVDDVVIPIVYRGPLDSLQPQVDPDYDLAGATIQSTIDNALRKALEKEGLGDLGGLIGDILGGGKKKGDGK